MEKMSFREFMLFLMEDPGCTLIYQTAAQDWFSEFKNQAMVSLYGTKFTWTLNPNVMVIRNGFSEVRFDDVLHVLLDRHGGFTMIELVCADPYDKTTRFYRLRLVPST